MAMRGVRAAVISIGVASVGLLVATQGGLAADSGMLWTQSTKPTQATAAESGDDVPPLPEDADATVLGDEDGGSKPRHHEASSESNNARSRWTFTGAIGTGSDFVSGQVTVGYYFIRYVGVETSYYYYQFSSDSTSGTQYGPEVDLVVRAFNPSIVTPFVGAGPGYTTWHRRYEGATFSSSSAATGNAFFGVDLNLTRNFGIEVMRKLETYWGTPPLSFTNRSVHEARSSWTTNIGFRVMF